MAYSGLTPTQVLRYLNRNLGVLLQELELTEDEMMRVVFQETLPTYSKFFPYRYRQNIFPDNEILSKINNYIIPNEHNLEIIGIHKVFVSNMSQYGNHALPLTVNPFETQMLNDFISMTVTPITWEYIAPNRITIYPKIVHPKHLKTIPMNMRDEFLKMALLDVLVSLYPLRHRFESFNTAYGELRPFLDMVDRATDERTALLEKWQSQVLKASKAKRIFIG